MAVSGGPDSLALLLLAHAALPGQLEAATVDHGLRPESADEAAMVARLCAESGVPHARLAVEVAPGNLQAEARVARYRALAAWAAERGLDAIATAHHADDQAETLLMRLNRGSGVAGLAGVRPRGCIPDAVIPLVRPLLGWRRHEFAAVCAAAGIAPALDPSNTDHRFDRARIREHLAGAPWIDPLALAASAAHLAEADVALEWATQREWDERVERVGESYRYAPTAPRAVRLRVLARAIRALGGEPRGGEIARLEAGQGGTLAGVLARREGEVWVLVPEVGRGAARGR